MSNNIQRLRTWDCFQCSATSRPLHFHLSLASCDQAARLEQEELFQSQGAAQAAALGLPRPFQRRPTKVRPSTMPTQWERPPVQSHPSRHAALSKDRPVWWHPGKPLRWASEAEIVEKVPLDHKQTCDPRLPCDTQAKTHRGSTRSEALSRRLCACTAKSSRM